MNRYGKNSDRSHLRIPERLEHQQQQHRVQQHKHKNDNNLYTTTGTATSFPPESTNNKQPKALVDEIARIEAELERKRLEEEIRKMEEQMIHANPEQQENMRQNVTTTIRTELIDAGSKNSSSQPPQVHYMESNETYVDSVTEFDLRSNDTGEIIEEEVIEEEVVTGEDGDLVIEELISDDELEVQSSDGGKMAAIAEEDEEDEVDESAAAEAQAEAEEQRRKKKEKERIQLEILAMEEAIKLGKQKIEQRKQQSEERKKQRNVMNTLDATSITSRTSSSTASRLKAQRLQDQIDMMEETITQVKRQQGISIEEQQQRHAIPTEICTLPTPPASPTPKVNRIAAQAMIAGTSARQAQAKEAEQKAQAKEAEQKEKEEHARTMKLQQQEQLQAEIAAMEAQMAAAQQKKKAVSSGKRKKKKQQPQQQQQQHSGVENLPVETTHCSSMESSAHGSASIRSGESKSSSIGSTTKASTTTASRVEAQKLQEEIRKMEEAIALTKRSKGLPVGDPNAIPTEISTQYQEQEQQQQQKLRSSSLVSSPAARGFLSAQRPNFLNSISSAAEDREQRILVNGGVPQMRDVVVNVDDDHVDDAAGSTSEEESPRVGLLAALSQAVTDRQERIDANHGELYMRDHEPETEERKQSTPQLSFAFAELITKKAKEREKRLEGGGEKRMTKIKEKSEYKKEFTNIALDAAGMGRLTRLPEVTVEAVAKEKTPEEEWRSHGLLAIQWRSNHMTVIYEAARTGAITKQREVVVSNFPEEEDEWDYDDGTQMAPQIRAVLDLKAGAGGAKLDKVLEATKEENAGAESILVRPMWCYNDIEDVKLPRARTPKIDPVKARERIVKMQNDGAPLTDISRDVATIAWERRTRLDRPGNVPKVKEKCECPYCENASPYQTYAYRIKEKRRIHEADFCEEINQPPQEPVKSTKVAKQPHKFAPSQPTSFVPTQEPVTEKIEEPRRKKTTPQGTKPNTAQPSGFVDNIQDERPKQRAEDTFVEEEANKRPPEKSLVSSITEEPPPPPPETAGCCCVIL